MPKTPLAISLSALVVLLAPLTALTQTPSDSSATNPTPRYDVASIRQNLNPEPRWKMSFTDNGVQATDVTLFYAIQEAWGVYDEQLWANVPKWIEEKRFDIDAKYDVEKYPSPTIGDRRAMLQQLLADRFHLVVHHEQKEFPVYELEVAKNGPKFTLTRQEDIRASSTYGAMCLHTKSGPGAIGMQGCTMEQFANSLTGWTRDELGRKILDCTGLPGRYTLALTWTGQTPASPNPTGGSPEIPAGPSVFTALQEQLGLTLKATKAPLDILIIDHVEMPTEN